MFREIFLEMGSRIREEDFVDEVDGRSGAFDVEKKDFDSLFRSCGHNVGSCAQRSRSAIAGSFSGSMVAISAINIRSHSAGERGTFSGLSVPI